MRGPNRIASDHAVRDRLRRLPADTLARKAAKVLLQRGDTLGALCQLQHEGTINADHVEAHRKWLRKQAEELAG